MANRSDAGAVVVTGASKGIGRACARRLARLGFRVYAGVRSDVDAEQIRGEGDGRILPIRLDVTDPSAVAAAAERIDAECGAAGLAGLVNNAGIAVAGPLEILPIDEFRRQLEVNVVGQLAVTQAFLPALRRARGRIVNMGSISGRSALPFTGAYAASKHALEAMTDALRVELRPWGIEVVIVEPGVIATPIWETSIRAASQSLEQVPAEALELYADRIDAVRGMVEHNTERGLPADAVARVVAHALTATRPKTRYLVGRDARLRAWLQRLPDRWRDSLIAWRLGREAASRPAARPPVSR